MQRNLVDIIDVEGEPNIINEIIDKEMSSKKQYEPMPPKALQVTMIVSEYYGVTIDKIFSRSRLLNIKIARFVAIHMIYKLSKASSKSKTNPITLGKIGHWFNRRDHTTVINVIRKVDGWLDVDEDFRMQYNAICRDAAHIQFGEPVKLTLSERIQRLPDQYKNEIIQYIDKIEKILADDNTKNPRIQQPSHGAEPKKLEECNIKNN